ncbi:hypothetical protein GCM10009069_28770 [Algimonas arctica]|uniref:Uncharacterized protein n=1 Tax=Algimonas arctica TaxID=1479486 RepID=A0A8J3G3P6_9PROT|nr:hypothetical protein [Algimonas arctica]GHB04427.1 hypothetical protein GCM10009069_28770 [Algimonas arctica]
MEEAWELAAVSDKIRKILVFEDNCFGDREVKLTNIAISADRERDHLDDEDAEQLIAAIARSESSTLGYAAAGFAPVLLLLNSLPYIDGLNDAWASILTLSATITLGFAGSYYAVYKAIFLSPRRIFVEAYRVKLMNAFQVNLFPMGKWQKLNYLALGCVPFGYFLIFALILRVLLT